MRRYLKRNYVKGLVLVREFNQLPQRTRKRIFLIFIIALVIALVGIGYRIIHGINLRHYTNQVATMKVAVVHAQHGPATEEVILPGYVEAWHEATIYARANGYIEDWFVDYGAHVTEGQLLAKIDTPELDAQLAQAEAELKTAIANYEIAQITNQRWQNLLKTESVSLQEAEEKASAEVANFTIVESARANRDHLLELVGFESVLAPFDGIITARNIDIGSLIDAGSEVGRSLFYIVQSNKLRVFVKVPQNYSSRFTSDMEVNLYFKEHPNKVFSAKLLNTAEGIDPETRTLLTQFEVANPDYVLFPGSYTEAHLLIPINKNVVRLPVNAFLFRAQGLQVATIDQDNKVMLKNVTVGRDFGTELEIVDGVVPGEAVILNPSDGLINGQTVQVVGDSKGVD